MIRWLSKPLGVSLLIGLASALLYAGWIEPNRVFETPRLKTTDLCFKLRKLLPLTSQSLKKFALVMIDEESITQIRAGWPLKRSVHADLIGKIVPYEPRVIGMDFIFAAAGEPADDFQLLEAMKRSGRVILVSFVDENGRYHLSRPEFIEASRGSGVANKPRDRDLTVRRTKLYYQKEDGAFLEWSWAMRNLIHAFNLSPEKIQIGKGVVILLEIEGKKVSVPLLDDGTAWINYRFKAEDVERISLWKVLEGQFAEDFFRNKIVLVGATSKDLHDYSQTPLGFMPGVLMHANFLANLIEGDFLEPVPIWGNVALVFVFIALACFTSLRFALLGSLLWFFGEELLLGATGMGLFLNNRVSDLFAPGAGISAAFLGVTLIRYVLMWVENVRLRGEVVTDPLTGLYTRRFLELTIDQELAKLLAGVKKRKTDPSDELTVLMIDVDHFKKINDTYGHPFGDEVLKCLGETLKESTRQEDVVVRYGGEEFCVVLVHTGKEEALRIAEKIRKAVEARKLKYVDQDVRFSISVGVASAREDHLSACRRLIQAADIALYNAKWGGRNLVYGYKNK